MLNEKTSLEQLRLARHEILSLKAALASSQPSNPPLPTVLPLSNVNMISIDADTIAMTLHLHLQDSSLWDTPLSSPIDRSSLISRITRESRFPADKVAAIIAKVPELTSAQWAHLGASVGSFAASLTPEERDGLLEIATSLMIA